jgi:hypothetical protein
MVKRSRILVTRSTSSRAVKNLRYFTMYSTLTAATNPHHFAPLRHQGTHVLDVNQIVSSILHPSAPAGLTTQFIKSTLNVKGDILSHPASVISTTCQELFLGGLIDGKLEGMQNVAWRLINLILDHLPLNIITAYANFYQSLNISIEHVQSIQNPIWSFLLREGITDVRIYFCII